MEIERKFLTFSDEYKNHLLEGSKPVLIEQAYLSIEPEIRIRKVTFQGKSAYWWALKSSNTGLVRDEVELLICEWQFESLSKHVKTNWLAKKRTLLDVTSDDGLIVADVNEYEGKLNGLVMIEVEFENEELAKDFIPPEWFGEEVTNNPAWKNVSLACGSYE